MPYEHQGIKAEVADVYMSIKDGLTDTELMELYPNEAYNIDKFERIRQRIKTEENATIRRNVEVWYIWRKNRSTEKLDMLWKNIGYENVYRVTDYKHPFDRLYWTRCVVFR